MAFLKTSRYAALDLVPVTLPDGRAVQAVKLRRLPVPTSGVYTVAEHDRVDGLAFSMYQDGTQFWHIGDANSDLEARDLTDVPGRAILVPKD